VQIKADFRFEISAEIPQEKFENHHLQQQIYKQFVPTVVKARARQQNAQTFGKERREKEANGDGRC